MSERKKVLVAWYHPQMQAPGAFARLEAAGFEVVLNRTGKIYDEAKMLEVLPGCFATLAGSEPYNARVLAAAPGLKAIARMGVGYDQVDVAAATRHGVAVAMAFGTNHEAVADHALALIGALGCQLMTCHQRVLGGGWGGNLAGSLWQSTVGILGLGRIGQALARRCRGFEMRILACDPYADAAWATANGVELVPIERLFAEADFVSVHAPHTPETDRIVNRERLVLMKPTAFLINTARGGLVDEAALIEALQAGRIAGAGLDVFAVEPLPADSPLRRLDNVLLTPHCAGANMRSMADMLNRCVDSILAFGEGRSPGAPYVLNPEVFAPHAAAAR
jgi:D-3-phosphoglycerate dehydrogenase